MLVRDCQHRHLGVAGDLDVDAIGVLGIEHEAVVPSGSFESNGGSVRIFDVNFNECRECSRPCFCKQAAVVVIASTDEDVLNFR